MIRTTNGSYQRSRYADEADLEAAIIDVQRDLFGANRIYRDMKKKIGTKGVMRNIPDGYLIHLKVTPLI
jgi:Trm5-related predicted tRNA methylase